MTVVILATHQRFKGQGVVASPVSTQVATRGDCAARRLCSMFYSGNYGEKDKKSISG